VFTGNCCVAASKETRLKRCDGGTSCGNGKKPISGAPQPGCWIGAGQLPSSTSRATGPKWIAAAIAIAANQAIVISQPGNQPTMTSPKRSAGVERRRASKRASRSSLWHDWIRRQQQNSVWGRLASKNPHWTRRLVRLTAAPAGCRPPWPVPNSRRIVVSASRHQSPSPLVWGNFRLDSE
jgi:hypothetical protein